MKTNLIRDLMAGRWEGLNVSAEALSELPGGTECEYVFFYKLTNPSQLFKATEIIEQEQYQMVLPVPEGSNYKGWLRVRKEKLKADTEAHHTLTLKVSEEGVSGRKELEVGIDEAFHECFKVICAEGMHKTRFVLPIEGTEGQGPNGAALKWEVDVFDDPEAEGAEHWVKVDLEVGAPLSELPEFPLSYEKSITNQWNQRTEEEQEFIKQLFAKVYTATKQPAETQPETTEAAAATDGADPATEAQEPDQAEAQPEGSEPAEDSTASA